jgi:hypothetical protein
MNTIKRVKILITLGLLANTLYITPLWAQAPAEEVSVKGTQMTAGELFDEALKNPFTVDENNNIVTTDEAEEFFNIYENKDGNLQIEFTNKSVERLGSMEPEAIRNVLLGLRDKLVETAPGIQNQYENLLFSSENGEEFARIDSQTLTVGVIGNQNKALDTKTTEIGTMAAQQESQVQSGMRPAQQQSAAGAAGAFSTQK